MAVISGIVLATSLFNAIPAQAWKNPVSRIVPTNISLEQDKILNPIVKEELNMIALDARVETESLKKEVFLEKKWLRQSKRDKSIEASQSSLKSTEIKLSTINTEEVKKRYLLRQHLLDQSQHRLKQSQPQRNLKNKQLKRAHLRQSPEEQVR